MAFSSTEFPGLTFGSIKELEAIRRARETIRKKLSEPVIVTAEKE